MKVALYARVSKADDTQDPENQLNRLRSYAVERQYEIAGEFVDRASGADAHRPQLDTMIKAGRAHRFSMILTVKVDRLARSLLNLETMVADLDVHGIRVEFVDQGITTGTAAGNVFRQFLGIMAEFERELIRERTKAGLARTRAEGTKLGRPACKVDMEQVARLRAQGWGVRRIATTIGISHQTLRNRLRDGQSNEGGDKPNAAAKLPDGLENGR
jgi:DNA invertase Pin-like site-specific DNA recombinase